jgi:hypothetical protein
VLVTASAGTRFDVTQMVIGLLDGVSDTLNLDENHLAHLEPRWNSSRQYGHHRPRQLGSECLDVG